jgi:electron transfer flavoprotein alpha subunit
VRTFNDEPYADLLSGLIQQYRPEIVLAGATPIGRSFIPRVAARLKAGLTADCTGLEIDEDSRNLLQVRPAFGGNIMATILCPHTRPQMATVRPRVMKRGMYDESREGEIIPVKADNVKSRTKVIETIKEVSDISVNLQEANVIVSGGRGTGGEKGFKLLHELAEALGASLGASRAAVDEGWIPTGTRSNRKDSGTENIYRVRHLRCCAACCRHAIIRHHYRDKQEPRGTDFRYCHVWHCRGFI